MLKVGLKYSMLYLESEARIDKQRHAKSSSVYEQVIFCLCKTINIKTPAIFVNHTKAVFLHTFKDVPFFIHLHARFSQ